MFKIDQFSADLFPRGASGGKAVFVKAPPFATSSKGGFGWRSGRRTTEAAKTGALGNCSPIANDCRVIVVDDTAVP